MKNINKKLASESFINFVNHENQKDVAKWETWIKENPQHEEVVERAILTTRSLNFEKATESSNNTNSQWEKLQYKIKKEAYSNLERKPLRRLYLYKSIALIAGVFILLSYLYVTYMHDPKEIFETGIGQKASIILPDGTEVTLNRNSRIYLYKDWSSKDRRKIWLEGEAYFNVKKKLNEKGEDSKFEVYTEDLTVSVIGTSFNMNTFGEDYVVLESGKINLKKNKRNAPLYQLKPNQKAQINKKGDIETRNVNTNTYISWLNDRLILEDNSVKEIILLLEERYGLSVQYENNNLLSRRLSGEIKIDNLDELLSVLETALKLKIIKNGNHVEIFEIENYDKKK